MTEPTETSRPTISPSTQESKVTEADNDETRVQVIEERLEAYKKELGTFVVRKLMLI
jgi:hypothetical protein